MAKQSSDFVAHQDEERNHQTTCEVRPECRTPQGHSFRRPTLLDLHWSLVLQGPCPHWGGKGDHLAKGLTLPLLEENEPPWRVMRGYKLTSEGEEEEDPDHILEIKLVKAVRACGMILGHSLQALANVNCPCAVSPALGTT